MPPPTVKMVISDEEGVEKRSQTGKGMVSDPKILVLTDCVV